MGTRRNSLLSTPKLFKYRPTLSHGPTKIFPKQHATVVLAERSVILANWQRVVCASKRVDLGGLAVHGVFASSICSSFLQSVGGGGWTPRA